ncbi:MAG: serine/threonine protein kinase, partial [Myxococcales bacterium]|nr:serine/threonine protein kinase [Myxococcales bacterium]
MSASLGAGDLLDGKYRIIRVIGEGGWGVVYEGENPRTLKRVAIKVLRARADLTPEIRTRFEREAQAGGRIGSEHIVEVFDLGSLPDGTHFLVMELLQGEDLATRIRRGGPLDPALAAKIVVQLLDGLGAAHRAGILHRDLKPENLYLVPTRSGEDFVKILDFGVSKFSAPGMDATRTGAVLGSPFYMAPEQARGL